MTLEHFSKLLLRGDRTRRFQKPGGPSLESPPLPLPGGAARFEARAAQRSATSRVPKALPNADHLLSLVGGILSRIEKKRGDFRFSPQRAERWGEYPEGEGVPVRGRSRGLASTRR